jgi:hypothetical protein
VLRLQTGPPCKGQEQGSARQDIEFVSGLVFCTWENRRGGAAIQVARTLALFLAQTFVDSAGPASFETPRASAIRSNSRDSIRKPPLSVCACRKSRLFASRLPVNAWPHGRMSSRTPRRWDGAWEEQQQFSPSIHLRLLVVQCCNWHFTECDGGSRGGLEVASPLRGFTLRYTSQCTSNARIWFCPCATSRA